MTVHTYWRRWEVWRGYYCWEVHFHIRIEASFRKVKQAEVYITACIYLRFVGGGRGGCPSAMTVHSTKSTRCEYLGTTLAPTILVKACCWFLRRSLKRCALIDVWEIRAAPESIFTTTMYSFL